MISLHKFKELAEVDHEMGRMMVWMKLIISNRILAVSILLLMIALGSISASILPLSGQVTPTYPIVHMQDTSVSFGSLVYAGRQINAEYVTASSQLVGDKIDSITLGLQRVGSPTGTAEIGIFNTNLSVKKLFGTIDVSTISTSFRDYEFTLAGSELYTIASGDRIGIKYIGGSSSRGVNVMIDRNEADPFDAMNSHRIRYESAWLYFDTVEDLYMILKQTHGESYSSTPQTVGLTVTTQNGAGNSITGYYITVRQNGALIGSGFSPRTFSIQTGQQYVIGVADYGTVVFHHWLDNGSTERYRTISVSSPTTITAVMCSSGSFCPPAGSPSSTPSISLNPTSGFPGVSVTVTGSAFSANSAVTVRYDGTPRATTPSSLTTSSSGTFSASFTVPSTSSGSHTVQATDNTGKSASAIFRDNSSGSSSSAPVANSQSVTTNENTPRSITLSGSDPNGDLIEFYIISEPAHGALTLIDQTSRQVRYTPWSYYSGPDSFTFVASDGVLDSSPATVSITVSNTAQKSTSRLVVESVRTNDLTVSGLLVSLSQNSVVIQTASTPFQFSLNSGQQYSITASNGNNLVFDHWLDTGSSNRNRTVSITDDTLLVAVYRTS
jgi:hypothetical protein